MRQFSKYVLYGTALLGIAGGSIAGVAMSADKSVALEVDGSTRTVHTTAGSVRGVLDAAGYRITEHDLVAPGPSSKVGDGARIVLRRGRLLHLTIDGTTRDVWVTAPTVAAALSQLGYSSLDPTSVSRDKRLPLTPTSLDLRSPIRVTVRHDGMVNTVMTTAPTVAQVLADLGITLGDEDKVSAPASSAPRAGQTIVLQRVRVGRIVTTESVPFPTSRVSDAALPWGETRVVLAGKAGSRQVTYQVVYVDERIVSRTSVHVRVLSQPVGAVVHVGTAAQTPEQAKAAARQLVADRGWDDSQFSCLDSLWTKESGWRVDAQNPDGGAYGIPQALPGSKMAAVGADWQTDAVTQITWGLNYIAGVYGTPCSAWGHSQALNWY